MTEQHNPEQQSNTGFPPPSGQPVYPVQPTQQPTPAPAQQPVQQQPAPTVPAQQPMYSAQQYPQQEMPQYAQQPPTYPGQTPAQQVVQPPNQQPFVEDGSKRHVHHTYVWLGSIQVAIVLILVFLVTGFSVVMEVGSSIVSGNNMGALALVGGGTLLLFLLIIAAVVVSTVLSYKNLYYEIGEKEFSVYSGVFSKKRVHIPYQRIQSVNQKATLSQRILGVCTIHIDTAGGSNNKAVVVPYLQNFEAERVRGELFARKQAVINEQNGVRAGMPNYGAQVQQGSNVLDAPAEIMSDVRGVFGGTQVDQGPASYEYGLSNKELIFTGLSSNTGFALMVTALIGSVFGLVVQLLATGVGQRLYSQGVELATRTFADSLIWVIVGSVIFAVAFIWVISIISTCIMYGGFKARRQSSRIEIEHGLLQHRFHGVDIDRVQSVIIKQSFIRRLIGYCEVSLGKIDAVQANSSKEQENALNQQGLIVHPFVKMDKVPEILAGLVPEFADVPTELVALPKVAKRRAVIRRGILYGGGFWLILIVAICQIVLNVLGSDFDDTAEALFIINMISIGLYALGALIMITDIIRALLWFKGSSFAYNKNFMQVTNGGFSRESISFPRKKIQYAYTRTNPFQRAAHVMTVSVRTAAGVGGTTMRLIDASEEDAKKWLDWARPGQGMVK